MFQIYDFFHNWGGVKERNVCTKESTITNGNVFCFIRLLTQEALFISRIISKSISSSC